MPEKENVVALLQGRLGSSRLPGKVLLPLAGKPVMQHVLERIRHCSTIDRIVIATSDQPQDDPIADLFQRLEVPVFRGSEPDPLDRFYHAAVQYRADHVVRIMADCPLTDPELVDGVIQKHLQGGFDFCCLAGEFPVGLDTTVYRFPALADAWQHADQIREREHIFPYITDHPEKFKLGEYAPLNGLLHHRWTMDHEIDYQFMQAVYNGLYQPESIFRTRDVLKWLDDHPEMIRLNQGIPRDEGLSRARAKDNLQSGR